MTEHSGEEDSSPDQETLTVKVRVDGFVVSRELWRRVVSLGLDSEIEHAFAEGMRPTVEAGLGAALLLQEAGITLDLEGLLLPQRGDLPELRETPQGQ